MKRHSVMRLIIAVVLTISAIASFLRSEAALGLILLAVAILSAISAAHIWNKDKNDRG